MGRFRAPPERACGSRVALWPGAHSLVTAETAWLVPRLVSRTEWSPACFSLAGSVFFQISMPENGAMWMRVEAIAAAKL